VLLLLFLLHYEDQALVVSVVRKPEGKRLLGRPKHRWVNNNKIDLTDIGCGCIDWIDLAQDRDRLL
jgi:hypothetical protein